MKYGLEVSQQDNLLLGKKYLAKSKGNSKCPFLCRGLKMGLKYFYFYEHFEDQVKELVR